MENQLYSPGKVLSLILLGVISIVVYYWDTLRIQRRTPVPPPLSTMLLRGYGVDGVSDTITVTFSSGSTPKRQPAEDSNVQSQGDISLRKRNDNSNVVSSLFELTVKTAIDPANTVTGVFAHNRTSTIHVDTKKRNDSFHDNLPQGDNVIHKYPESGTHTKGNFTHKTSDYESYPDDGFKRNTSEPDGHQDSDSRNKGPESDIHNENDSGHMSPEISRHPSSVFSYQDSDPDSNPDDKSKHTFPEPDSYLDGQFIQRTIVPERLNASESDGRLAEEFKHTTPEPGRHSRDDSEDKATDIQPSLPALFPNKSISNFGYNLSELRKVRRVVERKLHPKNLIHEQLLGIRKRPDAAVTCPPSCILDNAVGHYRTCAVVGNSGLLLGSGCGSLVNTHDYVIRIDLPVVEGYEQDVGVRTNMTILNSSTPRRVKISSIFKNRTLDVYEDRLRFINGSVLLAVKGRIDDIRRAVLRVYRLSFSLMHYPYPVYYKPYVSKLMGGFHGKVSTGIMAVLIATTFCDHVTLFGFYPYLSDMQNRTLPYHYYPGDNVEPIIMDAGGDHDMEAEFKLYQRWHENGAMRLVVGQCAGHGHGHGSVNESSGDE